MRFSDLSIALIAMAGPAYAQWKGNPAMKLKDVRPGHIEDMEALHKSIVSHQRTSAHTQTTANQTLINNSNAASKALSPYHGHPRKNNSTSSATRRSENGTSNYPSASAKLTLSAPKI
jgi:hypothetical protein